MVLPEVVENFSFNLILHIPKDNYIIYLIEMSKTIINILLNPCLNRWGFFVILLQ